MRRLALVVAVLCIAVVAFSQSMRPMGPAGVHDPPRPRDGEGPDTAVVPILIYHSVRPFIPSDTTAIRRYIATPGTLERELAWLCDNGYRSVTFDDLVSRLEKRAPLPPKPVIISFDDDWESQYTYALPLLEKYGFTATFYIWVSAVGTKHHMSWDEVRALGAAGMQIGCHTLTHSRLTRIVRKEELRREILEAKKRIEEEIGKPITTLAYPFGQYNERVAAVTREAGFTSARSTWPGVAHSAGGLFSLTGLIRTGSKASLVDAMTR